LRFIPLSLRRTSSTPREAEFARLDLGLHTKSSVALTLFEGVKNIGFIKAMKIGLFGGTFDPIHFGHLRSALEVREACGLERVVLIPAAVPPHKGWGAMAAAADRLQMIELAVAGAPGLAVSDVELRRAGPSYTIDTIRDFQGEIPGGEIALIVGLDAFLEIDTWKSFR
jgi:nicotinate-nucleotide adenylyltransferase